MSGVAKDLEAVELLNKLISIHNNSISTNNAVAKESCIQEARELHSTFMLKYSENPRTQVYAINQYQPLNGIRLFELDGRKSRALNIILRESEILSFVNAALERYSERFCIADNEVKYKHPSTVTIVSNRGGRTIYTLNKEGVIYDTLNNIIINDGEEILNLGYDSEIHHGERGRVTITEDKKRKMYEFSLKIKGTYQSQYIIADVAKLLKEYF